MTPITISDKHVTYDTIKSLCHDDMYFVMVTKV